MHNLIRQLKNNRFAFGMWPDPECYGEDLGKEMQEKARKIGKDKFLLFVCQGDGFWKDYFDFRGDFNGSATYRLRPDYEDEPEIVECKIYFSDDNGRLSHYDLDDGRDMSIDQAVSQPDFIGFKFADGCWRTSPIYYQMPTFCNDQIHPDKTSDFAAKIVLHATHVLFRRNKKE